MPLTTPKQISYQSKPNNLFNYQSNPVKNNKHKIIVGKSSPGEKMINAYAMSGCKVQQNDMIMRKILSPDATPPISDEEDNNKENVQTNMQSECVKDTYGSRDRINKPKTHKMFQVKKQIQESYKKTKRSPNDIQQLIEDKLKYYFNKLNKLQMKYEQQKQIDMEQQNTKDIINNFLQQSQESLTDKEAIVQYLLNKINKGGKQDAKIQDILQVSYLDNTNQLSFLKSIMYASHMEQSQDNLNYVQQNFLTGSDGNFLQMLQNNTNSFNKTNTIEEQSFLNQMMDKQSPTNQQQPLKNNIILACSPIHILNNTVSGNISYTDDLKALMSGDQRLDSIAGLKKQLNMNKACVDISAIESKASYNFGETFGNNLSKEQDSASQIIQIQMKNHQLQYLNDDNSNNNDYDISQSKQNMLINIEIDQDFSNEDSQQSDNNLIQTECLDFINESRMLLSSRLKSSQNTQRSNNRYNEAFEDELENNSFQRANNDQTCVANPSFNNQQWNLKTIDSLDHSMIQNEDMEIILNQQENRNPNTQNNLRYYKDN